jgi:tripartite-type tricarboxylate transporter receptor subunit TctC
MELPMKAIQWRLAILVLVILTGPSQAQERSQFPSRPVRLIVPSSPGGPVDAVARVLADALEAAWHRPVIVESKPGAGNSTGALYVANSPPDGYTLLVISDSITVNPSLYPNLDKDPLNQFEPISLLVTAPEVLIVRSDLGVSDLKGFVEAAKSATAPLNVATAGAGTISHLTEILLDQRSGIKTTVVPFRGASPAVTAVLGKYVDAAWVMLAPALPNIAAGQVKAIAVSSAARDPALPQVPTAEEAGVQNFQVINWQGLFAPHNTPASVINQIAQTVAAAMQQPGVRGRLEAVGFAARGDGPAIAAEQVRANVARWSSVVTRANIKVSD